MTDQLWLRLGSLEGQLSGMQRLLEKMDAREEKQGEVAQRYREQILRRMDDLAEQVREAKHTGNNAAQVAEAVGHRVSKLEKKLEEYSGVITWAAVQRSRVVWALGALALAAPAAFNVLIQWGWRKLMGE